MKPFALILAVLLLAPMARADLAVDIAVAVERAKDLRAMNTLQQADIDIARQDVATLRAEKNATATLHKAEVDKLNKQIASLTNESLKKWANALMGIAGLLLLGAIACKYFKLDAEAGIAFLGAIVSGGMAAAMIQYPHIVGLMGLIVPGVAIAVFCLSLIARAKRDRDEKTIAISDGAHAAVLPIRAGLIAPEHQAAAEKLALGAAEGALGEKIKGELTP